MNVFREFENLAIGVLDVFDKNTRDILNHSLVVRYYNHLEKDILELAVMAKCEDFVSHRLIQKTMDKIWFANELNVPFVVNLVNLRNLKNKQISCTLLIFVT